MKKKLCRLCCMLLCAAMILCLLPAMPVQAARTIETKDYNYRGESKDGWTFYTVETGKITVDDPETEHTLSAGATRKTVKTIVKDPDGDCTFETFEDLKYLAAYSYSKATEAVYAGPADFVFSESLTIPKNLELYFYDCTVTVAEGVQLGFNDSCFFDDLTVNGTMSGGEIYVEKSLTVNGSLVCQDEVRVSSACSITGKDKITYENDRCRLTVYSVISDKEALLAGMERAAKETDRHVFYAFDLILSGDIVLSESLTVPANSDLYIDRDADLDPAPGIVLREGAALTLNGYVILCVDLTVDGSLDNRGCLEVYHDYGGMLSVGSSGNYTGNGDLYVFSTALSAPDAAVPGLDLENFLVEKCSVDGWVLYNMDGLTQLPAPSEPQWGYSYTWEQDEETKAWTQSVTEIPGFMSWKSAVPNESEYSVNLYRVTDGTASLVNQYTWYEGSDDASEWISLSAFCQDTQESGTYYFEVKACGDFKTSYDSEYVTSPTWVYTNPGVQLGSCTDLLWDEMTMTWTAPADSAFVGGYGIDIAYSPTETGTPSVIVSGENYGGPEDTSLALPESIWHMHGSGYYFFRVRALSGDITKATNGSMSGFSPAQYLGEPHSYETVVTPPTCTKDGYTTYTCTGCGDSYVDSYSDALGHSFTNYVTDGNATCTADGTKTATCDRCEKTDTVTDEGSMIPHDYDFVITPPSCTKDGYTTHTCTGCGDSYVDSYSDALGHQYEDGICTVCGEADPNYTEGVSVIRIAGTSRSRTAYKAADELKEVLGIEKFDTIILASGDNFADALAGSYLAAVKKAPILLYRPNALQENATYITNNLADGGKVYILGGTASVSQEMEDTLTNSGIKVERLAGSNRYNTNLAILKEAGINGNEILVSTGLNFADSLSASATGLPILLVNSNSNKLTDSQIAFLKEVSGAKITIVGGTSSVSQELAEALSAYGTIGRVSGSSREKTSVAVAERYFPDADCAMVAYSRNYPDGLCGGPLAYILGAPLLLTDAGREAPAQVFVEAKGITSGIALGGPASVKDSSVRIVFAMAETDEIIVK